MWILVKTLEYLKVKYALENHYDRSTNGWNINSLLDGASYKCSRKNTYDVMIMAKLES